MPYKSRSQARMFFVKERAGLMPHGTAKHWAHATKSIKALPEHVKHKTAAELIKDAKMEKWCGRCAGPTCSHGTTKTAARARMDDADAVWKRRSCGALESAHIGNQCPWKTASILTYEQLLSFKPAKKVRSASELLRKSAADTWGALNKLNPFTSGSSNSSSTPEPKMSGPSQSRSGDHVWHPGSPVFHEQPQSVGDVIRGGEPAPADARQFNAKNHQAFPLNKRTQKVGEILAAAVPSNPGIQPQGQPMFENQTQFGMPPQPTPPPMPTPKTDAKTAPPSKNNDNNLQGQPKAPPAPNP